MKYKAEVVDSILQELINRTAYIGNQIIRTIYFGGGTPSLLSPEEVDKILHTIYSYYTLAETLEITLEANPDDLTPSYLKAIKKTDINRFSIGVQSFFEEDLKYMHRAHHAQEALTCIKNAQDLGFENLTIDLIYGSPTTSHQNWQKNLAIAFDLQVPHLSCYALTVEPKTILENHIKKGKKSPLNNEHTATQFEILLAAIQQQGYEQYEISNFCRDGYYAQHNTNYWTGIHYLGVGPAAHSFNGNSRRWNISHNQKYIDAIKNQTSYWETEELTPSNQYNEYIMTALRTKWGVQIHKLQEWGNAILYDFQKQAVRPIQNGWMILQEDSYVLTPEGKLIADNITSDFFI
jgi:oxygen-independent coproporphyrinogen-3 oxidase